MRTEVEARFRADDDHPLHVLATRTALGSAMLGPARMTREVDRYLDTDAGHLAKARWACRLRSREGTTRISLKGPPDGETAGWHHRRPEVEGPATDVIDPARWPDSEALELLNELRAGEVLHEVLRFDQARTERSAALRGGEGIGLLTLDRVRMSAGGADLGELFVVEVELDDGVTGGESILDELAAELADVEGLRPEPRSKLEHALERLAQADRDS